MKTEQEIVNKVLKLSSLINGYQQQIDNAECGEDTRELEEELRLVEAEMNAYMWLFN